MTANAVGDTGVDDRVSAVLAELGPAGPEDGPERLGRIDEAHRRLRGLLEAPDA